MHRLAIFNCKGGVGKTTTAMNLGAALARNGEQAILVDFDPQCHLTRIIDALPVDSRRSVFAFFAYGVPLDQLLVDWPRVGWLLPSHGQLMKVDSVYGKGPKVLRMLHDGLDRLESSVQRPTIIDCCPYMGVLALNAILASDSVLVPISADYLSLLGAQQVDRSLRALEPVFKCKLKRRYVLTRVDHRRKMGVAIYRQMKKLFGEDMCKTTIREAIAIAESPVQGCDVFEHHDKSKGADDYMKLYLELRAEGMLA